MNYFIKKAAADIRSNRILNLITIITISLSILVVSLFLLFFDNVSRVIDSWNQGGRIMIYLQDEFTMDMLPELKMKLYALGDIDEVVYISKADAIGKLKKSMSSQSSFFETLKTNPLPNAFQIKMKSNNSFDKVQKFAQSIKEIKIIDDVEYGLSWLGRFLKIFNLFKIAGYSMCGLFFLIALFITANTMRLAFYSREPEVEIMRLVGATEMFIKAPFYAAGFFQGFLGGVLGLSILWIAYMAILSGITQNFGTNVYFDIKFLSIKTILLIISGSTFSGWFGCYISLKQILK